MALRGPVRENLSCFLKNILIQLTAPRKGKNEKLFGLAPSDGLGSDTEGAVLFRKAVGHAGSAEGRSGIAFAIEKDESARGVHAVRQLADAGIGHELGMVSL